MQLKGKITAWNDNKGYGFITPIGSNKKVFVHIKSFFNKYNRPKLDEIVYYNVSKDKKGKLCAVGVTRDSDSANISSKVNFLEIIFAILFFSILGLLVSSGKLQLTTVLLYVAVSLITFITYAVDKSKSLNSEWRIPEVTLHMLALTGGWPGAIIAQQTLRHKSTKKSFRSMFFITVLFNISLLAFFIFSKKAIIY